jgi:hypothetical protein
MDLDKFITLFVSMDLDKLNVLSYVVPSYAVLYMWVCPMITMCHYMCIFELSSKQTCMIILLDHLEFFFV